MRIQDFQWMPDGKAIAKRVGIDKDVVGTNSDNTKTQGAAKRMAFLHHLGGVASVQQDGGGHQDKAEGLRSIPRDFFLVCQREKERVETT